ncbi:MAG: hypothetical protein GWP10_01220 [Nitrospiraceae bacterium]|nr:hypothetical protein [Nitrospiraceae bacterium]
MKSSLIYIDENLASSMALRYASQLTNLIDMALQIIHVEEPEDKDQSFGTGWTRRSWEHGLQEAGLQEVNRLLKTERIDCHFIGDPLVLVGDRESELLSEMGHHAYNLYIEGYLNTANVHDFYALIGSHLYRKMSCPALIVKNLVPLDRVLVLTAEGVDSTELLSCFMRLFNPGSVPVDFLHFCFHENGAPVWASESEAESHFEDVGELLSNKGWTVSNKRIVCGTPEQVAELLRDYGLIVSIFPTRKSPYYELLAMLPNPVLLCK